MSLTCCARHSIFKICFRACCMTSNKGRALGSNRVGSTQNLDEDVDNDDSNTITTVNGAKDELLPVNNHNILPVNEESNPSNNDANERSFQEGNNNADEVIVQQPINKIKIVNVTYQKTFYKKNTVNRKRISISDKGHINSSYNSYPSASVDSSPEGMR